MKTCRLFEKRVHSFRNLDYPGSLEGGNVLSGFILASEILDIPTDQNIREMLAKKKSQYTYIHKAIEDTLRDDPSHFCVKNGGITIVADDYDYDQQKSKLTLANPNIINGAQTQGVLQHWFRRKPDNGDGDPVHETDVYIKYEIIISNNADLKSDISISRNSQNSVQYISILGKSGVIDDLQKSMQAYDSKWCLRTKETDGKEYIDTEKLIQVLIAITPKFLTDSLDKERIGREEESESESEDSGLHAPKPNHSYKLMRSLRGYNYTYKYRTSIRKELYDFYVQIAPYAWRLCEEWQSDRAWSEVKTPSGRRTRAKPFTEKEEYVDGKKTKNTIINVPNGIIFPVLNGFSVFCRKDLDGHWTINIPDWFDKISFMQFVVEKYQTIGKNDPGTMGHNIESYNTIRDYVAQLEQNRTQQQEIEDLKKKLARFEKKTI